MPGLLPNVDPDGLLEFSVVYTDRSLNHMSKAFMGVINDISSILKEVYNAKSAVVVPGSGTYGMEAVARQFATDRKCLVIRNGWFSYRWTQIFEMGRISDQLHVMTGQPLVEGFEQQYAPPAIEEVVAWIHEHKPAVVFAPHVETSAGMILPPDYLRAVGEAVEAVDGLFVLDCIASGAMWVDMVESKVDVLVSAPQKGWSSSPCCALIGMSARARERIDAVAQVAVDRDARDGHHEALEGRDERDGDVRCEFLVVTRVVCGTSGDGIERTDHALHRTEEAEQRSDRSDRGDHVHRAVELRSFLGTRLLHRSLNLESTEG